MIMSMLAMFTLIALPFQDHPALVPGGDDLDIANVRPRSSCGADGSDIVVCGKNDPNHFRMLPIAPRYVEAPVRAATSVAGGRLSVEAERRSLPGAESTAAMIRFRVPLGKIKK
jgi:hypothetical protein